MNVIFVICILIVFYYYDFLILNVLFLVNLVGVMSYKFCQIWERSDFEK